MPQVPVYGDTQVRTDALRPVMQRTPDVSSGARALAQGLGDVGEAIDRIDLRNAQAKASETEAKITSDWLQWDAENRNKFRGANADGYAPAAEEWWKKAAEAAGQELSPRAKTLASQSLRSKQVQAMGNVLSFSTAEKERHADETYSADVATTIQFGVTSGDVAGTAQQIREKAAVVGARKGWTTEQVQAEAGKNLSAMHLAQITKLASTDATAAQAYYDTNKGEVNFAQQARVEEVLKGEMDNQFATQEAARLADKPLSEQLAEAAKITDPQRREKTITQIRNNYALVKQAEQERQNANADQAWQLFAQGRKIPEAILSGMSGKDRVQLQESQRTRAERLAAGTAVKTDFNTWYELQDKISRGERVDLRAYTEKVSASDLQALAKTQQSSSKPGGQEGLLTKQQRVDGVFLELTGKAPKDDPAKAYTFAKAIDARMMAESAAKNRALTPSEESAIIDSVTKDAVYVKGFWGNDQMPAALVPTEDQASAFVVVPVLDANGQPKVGRNNVPLTKRQSLAEIPSWFRTRALKSGAKTEQQIAEDYVAAKAKGLVK
jgi:PIN domain nuclease of toxin-antitoxin system